MFRPRGFLIICILLFACLISPAAGFMGVDIEAVKKAAEEGNAEAQAELGVMYSQGIGVDAVNKAEALKWYQKSAEQGNANGQWNLGFMYVRGDGVKEDLPLARQWFRKSAEQGYAPAQFDLAYMLWTGLGGEVDQEEALDLFRKSADQGYREARKVLQDIEAQMQQSAAK